MIDFFNRFNLRRLADGESLRPRAESLPPDPDTDRTWIREEIRTCCRVRILDQQRNDAQTLSVLGVSGPRGAGCLRRALHHTRALGDGGSLSRAVSVNAMERAEIKINAISEQLGLSWAGQCAEGSEKLVSAFPSLTSSLPGRAGPGAAVRRGRHQQDPRGEPQLAAGPERGAARPVGQQGGQTGQE